MEQEKMANKTLSDEIFYCIIVSMERQDVMEIERGKV